MPAPITPVTPPHDEDRVLAAIQRLERRLESIEARLERANALEKQVGGAVGTAVDTFDSAAARLRDRGVDPDERLRAGLDLLEQATAPETVQVLKESLALAHSAPKLAATIVDTLDSLAARAAEAGIDVDERTRDLLIALERLTSPTAISVLTDLLNRADVLRGFLDSGLLDPATVSVVSRAGRALAMAASESTPRVGAWGAVRALGDRNVQKAVGFALHFAARLGAALDTDTEPKLLATTKR
jgi:uncharacterized protein YjgD (DUF1641 family)